MSNEIGKVKTILESLVDKVETTLKENSFFFLNEHDLSAYLYSQLLDMQEFQPFKIKRNGKEYGCCRIHVEYPRYSIVNNKLKSQGRYDVAILRELYLPDLDHVL